MTFEQGPEESEGECHIDIYSIPDRGQEVQSSEEGVCLAGPQGGQRGQSGVTGELWARRAKKQQRRYFALEYPE